MSTSKVATRHEGIVIATTLQIVAMIANGVLRLVNEIGIVMNTRDIANNPSNLSVILISSFLVLKAAAIQIAIDIKIPITMKYLIISFVTS